MLKDKIYAVVCVIWQQDIQDPWLLVINFAPADGQEVWIFKVSLDVVYSWQCAPAYEFANTLFLRFRLKHKEDRLTNDDIHVDDHSSFNLFALLIKTHELFFLRAWINCDSRVFSSAVFGATYLVLTANLVLHPDLLVVILEPQIELADHWSSTTYEVGVHLAEDIRNKCGDMLDQLIQVHRRSPFTFFTLNYVFALWNDLV